MKRPLLLLLLLIISMSEFSKYSIIIGLLLFISSYLNFYGKNHILLKKFNPLILIFIIGCISGLDYFFLNTKYFLKDLLYFSQPIIFLFIGFLICNSKNDFTLILRISVIASILISAFTFFNLFKDPELLFNISFNSRYESQISNIYGVVSTSIILYAKKSNIRLFKSFYENLFLTISILSVLPSFSRTYYFLLFLIFIMQWNFIYNYLRKSYYIIVLSLVMVMFGSIIFDLDFNSLGDYSFENKVKNSLSEILIHKHINASMINTNWRGYESYLAMSSFYEGDLFDMIFGKGFGATVKVPNWIFDEDSSLNIIPFFHNGYITVLFKTGLIGLVLFFTFLRRFFKLSVRNFDNLMINLVFMLIIQTLVVHGIYYSSTTVLILILLGSTYKYNLKTSTIK